MAGFGHCRCDPIQRAFSLTTSSHPPFSTTEQLKKGSNESTIGWEGQRRRLYLPRWELAVGVEGRERSERAPSTGVVRPKGSYTVPLGIFQGVVRTLYLIADSCS
jgi:hypothetical protein